MLHVWQQRPMESIVAQVLSRADRIVLVRQRNARSLENIAAVRESLHENSQQSIPRRAQELNQSSMTTWCILRRELKPNDHRPRRAFADSALEQLEVDPNIERKIMFSDEVHFWLSGFVNMQNC